MTPLPSITGKELIAVLKKHGFAEVRQRGSHVIMRHADGRRTTVPLHSGRTIGKGLLRKIINDADLSLEDLSR